jgi:hypothetical protein
MALTLKSVGYALVGGIGLWGAANLYRSKFGAESFKDWADDEERDHGDITFSDWAEQEYEEPAHKNHLLLSFLDWVDEEKKEKSRKDAEYTYQTTGQWELYKTDGYVSVEIEADTDGLTLDEQLDVEGAVATQGMEEVEDYLYSNYEPSDYLAGFSADGEYWVMTTHEGEPWELLCKWSVYVEADTTSGSTFQLKLAEDEEKSDTPILDKVINIEIGYMIAYEEHMRAMRRQELLEDYLEEYGHIISKQSRKSPKLRKEAQTIGEFPYRNPFGKGGGMRPAANEYYSVEAYLTSSYSNPRILVDGGSVQEALSAFKAACDSGNYFTVEMYRHRQSSAMRGHPAWESRPAKRHQKTLVLKCKYDYITSNDQQFLGFVKSDFDEKWRFQAEEERICKGTTKKGNPCRVPSKYVLENGYCMHHGPNTSTPRTIDKSPKPPSSSRIGAVFGQTEGLTPEALDLRVIADDKEYDEWRKENVFDLPATTPAWANVAGEILYGTKWWDVNWMRDGEHPVVDGPEQYEDIWEKDLPWYWGRLSPEEATHFAKYPILDATQDVVPPLSPKKLTKSSKKLILRLKESGMEIDDLED